MRHYGDVTIPLEFWGRDEVYHVTEVEKKKLDDRDIMALRYVAMELFGNNLTEYVDNTRDEVENETFICDGELYLASGEGYLINCRDWIDPETGEVLSMEDEWIARSLYMDVNRRIILSVEIHNLDKIVDFLVY